MYGLHCIYYATQISVPNSGYMISALSRSLDGTDIYISAVQYTNVNDVVLSYMI